MLTFSVGIAALVLAMPLAAMAEDAPAPGGYHHLHHRHHRHHHAGHAMAKASAVDGNGDIKNDDPQATAPMRPH